MADVLVIGAGANGLAAAAYLARAGHAVRVLERREIPGGIAAREELAPGLVVPGLVHDTTRVRPEVISELDLERHGLALADAPPVLAPAPDGPGLLYSEAETPAGLSAADVDGLRRFRERLATYRPLVEALFSEPPPDLAATKAGGLWELAKGALRLRRLGERDMTDLLRVLPMCAADWLGEHLSSEPLKALLAAPAVEATWTGPWSAGSATQVLFHEALRGRAVAGGPAALTAALAKAAQTAGARIALGAEVARVTVASEGASASSTAGAGAHGSDGGRDTRGNRGTTGPRGPGSVTGPRVTGVELANGERLAADHVLATCDPRRALLALLPPRTLPPSVALPLRRFRQRGTTARVALLLDGPLEYAHRRGEPIAHARVPASIDALERAFDAIKYDRFAERLALDVRVPSLDDPTLAPAGKTVVTILVHFVPHALEGGWTDAARAALYDAVLATLEPVTQSLRERIVEHAVETPADLAERYALPGGHLHHGEHALDQLLHLRPTPACAFYATPLAGLWLGGAGSHPGGGLTCAPGRLAARALAARA